MKARCASSWRPYLCRNAGIIQHEGKWYCGQHYPKAVRVREDAEKRSKALSDSRDRVVQAAKEWVKRCCLGLPSYYEARECRDSLAAAVAELEKLEGGNADT